MTMISLSLVEAQVVWQLPRYEGENTDLYFPCQQVFDILSVLDLGIFSTVEAQHLCLISEISLEVSANYTIFFSLCSEEGKHGILLNIP